MRNKAKFHVGVFRSDSEGDLTIYEELRTRMLAEDSITLIKEETTFTKEGSYVIALQWIEETGQGMADDIAKIKSMIGKAI